LLSFQVTACGASLAAAADAQLLARPVTPPARGGFALKILDRLTWTGILAAALAGLLAGCGDSDGTAGSSATPQAVNGLVTRAATSGGAASTTPKSSDATSGNATLYWEAPTSNTNGTALTDLSGYRIYYGASEDDMIETVQIGSVGIQTYVIENLSAGTWYFAVRALSSEGTESPLSEIVSKTIG
jgi:hypothetical protein